MLGENKTIGFSTFSVFLSYLKRKFIRLYSSKTYKGYLEPDTPLENQPTKKRLLFILKHTRVKSVSVNEKGHLFFLDLVGFYNYLNSMGR